MFEFSWKQTVTSDNLSRIYTITNDASFEMQIIPIVNERVIAIVVVALDAKNMR